MSLDWDEKILRYAAGQCSDAESLEVYRALRSDPVLMKRYRAVSMLRANPERSWAEFTGTTPDSAASSPATTSPESLGSSVSRVSIFVRGAFDEARNVVVAVAEKAGSFLAPVEVGLVPAYRGVADPAADPEIKSAVESSLADFRRGEVIHSLETMASAADRAPGLKEEVLWNVVVGERTIGELQFRPAEGRLIVRIPDDEGSWTVLVVDDDKEEEYPLREEEGLTDSVAEISLPPGQFELFLRRD